MRKAVREKSGNRAMKIGIVASRFNEFITKRLMEGCLSELARCGVRKSDITVIWVPGSFEIPLAALILAKKKNVRAVICLGAVIKGETMHFDLVARAAAEGIMHASLLTGKPVIFGVLATGSVEQAYKRSDEKGENKGRDAAQAAIDMADGLKRVAGQR